MFTHLLPVMAGASLALDRPKVRKMAARSTTRTIFGSCQVQYFLVFFEIFFLGNRFMSLREGTEGKKCKGKGAEDEKGDRSILYLVGRSADVNPGANGDRRFDVIEETSGQNSSGNLL